MNKTELTDAIAAKSGLNKTQAAEALNATIEAIKETLAKGEEVNLIGFGSFKVGERQARTGHNPQTGAAIKIAACKVAKFTPGKALKEAVNK